jgi:Flp pilus assembly protein CpaB
MSRRTIAIIIFIIGILLLSAAGFFFIQQQNQPTAPPPGEEGVEGEVGALPPDGSEGAVSAETPFPTPEGDMVGVVVSLQTVPRGHFMTEDILAVDMRPRDTVDANVITDTAKVIGQYARTDIYQGQTLTQDKVVNDITLLANEAYGPSSLIPPGFVAQSLPINRISSVAYGISEGDYVDIMILFSMYEIDEEFQTFLPNDAAFFLEEQIQAVESSIGDEEASPEGLLGEPIIYFITPYGRFEELPTGDLAHVSPSEFQRPNIIGMVIQNAKVIQVGPYTLPLSAEASLATPTPEPVAEGEPTPTPAAVAAATATPLPPDVVLVALQPQQQLLLRYAMEVGANIDLAMRGINDGQLYSVENLTLEFLLERFSIDVPPNFGYTVDTGGNSDSLIDLIITPTPEIPEGDDSVPSDS